MTRMHISDDVYVLTRHDVHDNTSTELQRISTLDDWDKENNLNRLIIQLRQNDLVKKWQK